MRYTRNLPTRRSMPNLQVEARMRPKRITLIAISQVALVLAALAFSFCSWVIFLKMLKGFLQ